MNVLIENGQIRPLGEPAIAFVLGDGTLGKSGPPIAGSDGAISLEYANEGVQSGRGRPQGADLRGPCYAERGVNDG
jgi:hypothetical protein